MRSMHAAALMCSPEKRDLVQAIEEARRRCELDRDARPYRVIHAVKISDDHGETWRTRALCDECFSSIEPPTRARKNGVAGVGCCERCAARNEIYKS